MVNSNPDPTRDLLAHKTLIISNFESFSIGPNQFTHHHFKSISSSTINLQILTKKKQIRGNKVPNDGDDDGDEGERQK